jgi:DNA replication protein DnaC
MEEVVSELCPKCAGTGWEVVSEGGTSRARRCMCSVGADTEKLFAATKIPPRYSACDFETYIPQSFGQGKIKNLVMNYAQDYPLLDEETFRERSLLFTGGAGRGKTHLGIAILKTLLKKGVPCLFVDFHELLSEIRSSYDEISQTSEYQILHPILNVEVLMLDDLGSIRMTDWMQDTVFHIINLRYNYRRPLIVTSNLGMEGSRISGQETLQDRLGYRVISRLYEMCTTLELDGPDYRRDVRKAGGDFLRSKKEGQA